VAGLPKFPADASACIGKPKEEAQISLTDPDSRAMAAHTKVDVGYNIQIAVDAKNKMIVEQAMTNHRSAVQEAGPNVGQQSLIHGSSRMTCFVWRCLF
jgi:hypothetical protein